MKKILIITLISLVIIASFIILLFLYSFRTQVQKEIVNLSKEKIYLKHLSRGLNFEINVLTKHWYTPERPDTSKEYVDLTGRSFFYKVKDDNLIIYGGEWCNAPKNLISNIKFIKIRDSLLIYRRNYKKFGLKMFPPSEEKFFK